MESNRQLIQAILHYSFSFTPVKKANSNVSATYQQIHQSQMLNQTFSTWLDLANVHCKQILEYYPFDRHLEYYNEQVCLIDAQLKFQGSTSASLKYTLIKSKRQVQHFKKQYNQKMHRQHQEKSQNIFEILSHYSVKGGKDKRQFQDFIEQVAPHDKWNIRVLGQYLVSDIQEGSLKSCMNQTVCKPCGKFNKYYLTIANQCILYSDENLTDGVVEQAIPYTYALQISYIETLGNHFVAKVISGRTQITAAFEDLHDLIKFAYTINLVKKSLPHYFNLGKEIQSFSPVRENNWTHFYSDGESYFSDLHDQIEKAQKKICITGWCITPYLLLKRPQNIQNGQSRLDKTLARAAKRGVKIFIIVFQEPSLLLSNDSFNVWSMFQNMSENFKVLRHPGLIIPILWSHHEKSVIIDEKVGFMGGLDICYGRWDTHEHPIHDQNGLWQGADYNNERQRGITDPRQYFQSNLNRENEPRMPWHDIALQVKGPSVIDLQRHFCQYWYFAIHDLTDDVRDQLRNFKTRYDEIKRQRKDQKQKDQELFNKPKLSSTEMKAVEVEYANSRQKDHVDDYTFSDRVRNAKQALKDLVQNNQAKTSKQIIVQGFCVNQKPGNMKLQLCRSSSTWSTGISTTECSIYQAYLKLIKQAKDFIYIENQFFMSYENWISEEIAKKIIEAYEAKRSFKVIVMMPLLPGFQGDPRSQKAGVLRAQMQLQFDAISRDKNSIFQIVNAKYNKINLNDYIYFFGLRNHALFGPNKDVPKTQIIYVHSKLMIVDDKHMIIGSANINDRSLLGSRDSELAMVIEDPKAKYGEGEIFNFRYEIFHEHFGMNERNCKDLDGYWNKLIDFATKNTEIYREVFGCYPDNTAVNFGGIAELEKKANPQLYFKKIQNLYGHYVEWPVNFLKEQNLSIKFGQKEYLVPASFLA